MSNERAERLIAAIRARGSDARDLRDAAHEAHHALSAKVKGPWGRETIHRFVMRLGRSDAAADEILARSVEQIVCADLGVDPEGDLDKWIGVSCMEAITFRIPFPPYALALSAGHRAMTSTKARRAADAVLALADTPAPATKARRRRKVAA